MVERVRLKKREPVVIPSNSKYDPKFVPIARTLCSFGAKDAELADAFGVHTDTIQYWLSAYPEFGAAVFEGKSEVFDPKVERALAQLAVGYAVDVEEVKVTKDGDEVRYTVRKHFPPNVAAAIFWLKNRQPHKWRDVWKIEHEGKLELEKLTSAQLLEEIRKEATELGILPETLLKSNGVAPAGKGGNGKTKH